MEHQLSSPAVDFQRVAQMTRAALYGSPNDEQLPLNLQADARVPFLGFCGSRYKNGGVVLLAINPGGGGDAYASRTPQDSDLIPLIERFVAATPSQLPEAFDCMCKSYSTQVETWNLWRILQPTLEACNASLLDVCYLNLFPYRTAKDARPASRALNAAWIEVVTPLIRVLKPSRLVALGKKAGRVVQRVHLSPPPLFVVPRTIGDSYVSAEATQALAAIHASAT